jgi:hypothetical protein
MVAAADLQSTAAATIAATKIILGTAAAGIISCLVQRRQQLETGNRWKDCAQQQ